MTIDRKDLSFTYDAHSYMLSYKGKTIGGAGVINRNRRLTPTQRTANLRDFRESAERAVEGLVAGRGSAYMLDAIRKIDTANADA